MLRALEARVQRAAGVARRVMRLFARARPARLVTSAPSPQTAVDAVPESWASRFPPPLDAVRAGHAGLFEDPRLVWAFDQLGGVDGKTILELGPLEGAHSYMAQRAGARRVVGVEANTMAFLKCLVTKELMGLDRCSFLCGDVLEYMRASDEHFDLCLASGILYHMVEPMRMIDLISRRAAQICIWTHIYQDEACENEALTNRLGPEEEHVYLGFHHHLFRYDYEGESRFRGHCGGTSPYSNWLLREDLMRALDHFGWSNVRIGFEEPRHPNGPALALVAERAAGLPPGASSRA